MISNEINLSMNHVSSALSFLSFQRLNMSVIGLVCKARKLTCFLLTSFSLSVL